MILLREKIKLQVKSKWLVNASTTQVLLDLSQNYSVTANLLEKNQDQVSTGFWTPVSKDKNNSFSKGKIQIPNGKRAVLFVL